MTLQQAQALLAQRRQRPHRWHPLDAQEKQAIRVVQAVKAK